MADPSSKRKSRILVPSAGAGGHLHPACVENTGDGRCARTSSMRKRVIYARAAADPRVMYAWRGHLWHGRHVWPSRSSDAAPRLGNASLEAKFGVKPREAQ